MVKVIQADIIVRLVISSTDGNVMVVRDAGSFNLFLPIRIGSFIGTQFEIIGDSIIAQIGSSRKIKVLTHVLNCHIAVIAHMRNAFLSFFRRNDDNAIGCFRTINSRCSGIAQHIDALDIIGRDK